MQNKHATARYSHNRETAVEAVEVGVVLFLKPFKIREDSFTSTMALTPNPTPTPVLVQYQLV